MATEGGKKRVKKRLFGNISKLVENQRRNMFDKNKPLGSPQKPVETPGAKSPPSPRYGPNKGQKRPVARDRRGVGAKIAIFEISRNGWEIHAGAYWAKKNPLGTL